MSMLEALNVQGIRSFDPKSPQVLQFLKPVTLILGQNGTGKTTIIESLKYATCGEFPIGSKVGGSFVHDPKIAGESEVKAKVSLEIVNLKGEMLTVTRILKATQKDKNKQVSIQTLDSCIKISNGERENVSISSKCSDIDLQMSRNLGVSKAVLENVVFCHQEDSNWPLAEGKSVKDRFDELFASVRYTKALDSIRKIKQDKETSVKEFKPQLKFLKDDLDESNKKLSEKIMFENQVNLYNEKIEFVKSKLAPIEIDLERYRDPFGELCANEKDRERLLNEKKSTKERIQQLKKNISKPIDYSCEEIKKLIEDSDRNLLDLKTTVSQTEKKINSINNNVAELKKENEKLLLNKGKLNSKIELNKNQEVKFQDSVKELVQELGIPYVPNEPHPMMDAVKKVIHEMKFDLAQKLNSYENELKVHQDVLESIQSQKTRLEHEIGLNKTNLRNKQNALRSYETKVKTLMDNSTKLSSIDENLTSLKLNLDTLKSSFDAASALEETEKLSEYMSTLGDNINKTDNILTEYRLKERKYNEINSLQQQRSEKLSNVKRLRSRHNEVLEILFDNAIPESGLKKNLDQKIAKLNIENHEYQGDITKCQSNLTRFEVELTQMKKQITENQNLVNKFEEDVYSICGNFQLDSSLGDFKDKKSKLDEELLTIQSNASLYTKFREMLSKNNSDCPLCHREFNHQSEVNDLIEEINEKCNNVPVRSKAIQEELDILNKKIEELIILQSRSIKLNKSLIIDLENKSQIKKKEISEVQYRCSQLMNDLEKNIASQKTATSIVGDVANMEKYNDEIEYIDKNLRLLQQYLTESTEEFRTQFEEIQKNKKDFQNDLSKVKKEYEEKRKAYDNSVKQQTELTTKIHNLESQSLKIREQLQELRRSESQKDALLKEISEIEQHINSSSTMIAPVNVTLEEKKCALSTKSNEKKIYESETQKKIFRIEGKYKSVDESWKEITRFNIRNINEELKNNEEMISNIDQQFVQHLNDEENLKKLIAELKERIGNHNIEKRDLQDTLQVRYSEENIEKINNKIEELNSKLSGIDINNMKNNLTNLEKTRIDYKKEIDSLETQMIQVSTKIECIDRDLSTDRYLNASSNYLDMIYQLKTTELAISDLEKYYKALDKAIMSYHQTKMTEINKILKEYWQNTYSGKDIDYVEICSDEDKSAAGAKKRNYNYRVVMVKSSNGARLDMRGRCSAGQKVLASLLIRLALAEVFCINCGVMALDEPTTNLDQENIESLAYALVEVIKTRSKQKNFQLIVITHDEEFVKLLGRSDDVDEYYRIYSDSNGHSKIEKTGMESKP